MNKCTGGGVEKREEPDALCSVISVKKKRSFIKKISIQNYTFGLVDGKT